MTEKLVESLGILHEEKRKFWVNPLHPLKQSVRFRGRSKESGGREGGGATRCYSPPFNICQRFEPLRSLCHHSRFKIFNLKLSFSNHLTFHLCYGSIPLAHPTPSPHFFCLDPPLRLFFILLSDVRIEFLNVRHASGKMLCNY